ncbi:MAG: sigma factor-like helix-turn-helix DNA-binding protein [Lutibacter sp.]|nr:sigma factor-like helix-turn-helix DNA-binding protein [Lutibacter sp.]MDO9594124.1 sigma factor-like helix-turn-helix DNA-binding protein [Lutibacter sp.]
MKIKEPKHQETNFEEFYKKSSSAISSLKKFAASKLKLAEKEGLVDKGFYDANEILDEVFLEVFKVYSSDIDEKHLRQILFLRTIQKINHKIEKENQFAEDINIDAVLKDELNLLKEDYSVEADGDYIFDEDLDDISYQQNRFNPAHFILDQPMELELTGKLDLSEISLFSDRSRVLFGATFYTLPPISKNIIELYVFGNLDILEIAETLKVSEDAVRKVIDRVKQRLEKL